MNGPLSARSGPSTDLLPLLLTIVAGAVALAAGLADLPAIGVAAIAAMPLISWFGRRRRSAASDHAAPAVLDGWRAFRRELQRSRRGSRPLTIVRIPGATGTAAGEIARRRVRALIGEFRRIDHVWSQGGDVYALLPETDRRAADAAVERAATHAALPLEGLRMAAFPDDGLTSSALVDVLRGGDRVAGAGLRPVADASAPVLTLPAPAPATAAFTATAPSTVTASGLAAATGMAAVGPALVAAATRASAASVEPVGAAVRAARAAFSSDDDGSGVALA